MDEILSLLLQNEALRDLIVDVSTRVAARVVADIMHRRASDPDFLNRSDATFSLLSNAKTEQEKTDAQAALSALMSRG